MRTRGLGHVRWLGGATGAGKSTVAAALATGFGVGVHSTDATIAAHAVQPGPETPLLGAFGAMGMDERWLQHDAPTMLATFPWFAGERFDHVVRDLRVLPSSTLVVAEGFRLLPRLVAPWVERPWHGVWLTASTEFRRRAFQQRAEAAQFWRRTTAPAEALDRLLARDALFAAQVVREARSLGFRVVSVDEAGTVDELVATVAEWFRLDER